MSNINYFNNLRNADHSISDQCNSQHSCPEQQLANSMGNNNDVASNNIAPQMNLRSVDEIPKEYRQIFSSYHYFNVIQSKVLDSVLHSDDSIVVSAPTGSGKTVIFELAVIRFLQRLNIYEQQIPYKIVYVAPMKALCEERLVDWFPKFSKLGLSCISVTGDSDYFDLQNLVNHNFIITTPEKWDSLTRRWRDNKNFVPFIKLFMVDEVHLLNDQYRGPTVEVIVSRMKTIQTYTAEVDYGFGSMNLRFVAVSATIPNVEDIAEWLSVPGVKAQSFKFGDDMRPVKLKKVVVGYNYNAQASTPFKFDIMLNYKLHSIMLQHAEGKPTLIFCGTRKNVEMTSKYLTQNITIKLNHRQVLQEASACLSENKLKEAVVHGIAFHHAGLPQEDRKIVEDLFRNSNLPILVTTSTLAMGINLPAHLVIIKSTKHYCNGEYQDYSESMLLQMIGRAGRPQFDNSATAVILTTSSDKHKYENMVDGIQPVESNLHKNLTEHLNAEVVLNTITDLTVALEWVTSTFLYIRAGKNPKHYGFANDLTLAQIDKKLLDMCHIQINKLAYSGMLTIDENDILIAPTQVGILMAKYYVAFDTMILLTKVSGNEVLSQILSIISKCDEFSEMFLRVNDKKTLNLLNKCRGRETIRFPFNEKIKTLDMKINCIIQAVFGCLPMSESSLVNESRKIMRVGERIANCLSEYLSSKHNCFSALLNTLIIAKCFHVQLWENSPYVSRQLLGIGTAFSNALTEAGKISFVDILQSNPRDIERIINRKPPMGNTIQDQIKNLPEYYLEFKELCDTDCISIELKVHLRNAELLRQQSTVDKNSTMTLLVGDTNNDILLLENIKHRQLIEASPMCKTFTFPQTYNQRLQAHFISTDWVGIDRQTSFYPSSTNKNLDPNDQQANKYVSPKPTKRDTRPKTSQVQMHVDTYFKKQKGLEKLKNKEGVCKRLEQNKKSDPSSNNEKRERLNNEDKQIEINNEIISIEDTTIKTETVENILEQSVKECKKIIDSKSSTSCNLPRCYEASTDVTQYPVISNPTTISSTPTVTGNSNGEVNSQSRPKANKYKFIKNMNSSVDFESLIFSEQLNRDKQNISKYKNQPRKKLECTITSTKASHFALTPKNNSCYTDERSRENDDSSVTSVEEYMSNVPLTTEDATPLQSNGSQKTITWRSPLVISPSTKYSPILAKGGSTTATNGSEHFTNTDLSWPYNEDPMNSFSQAISDSTSLFTQASVIRPTLKDNLRKTPCTQPLSDKHFYAQKRQTATATSDREEINTSSIDDIVSQTFLESLGVVKQPKNSSTTPTRTTHDQQYCNLSKPNTVSSYHVKSVSTLIKDNQQLEKKTKVLEHTRTNQTNVETQTSELPVKTTQDAATSPIRNTTFTEPLLFDMSPEMSFFQMNDVPSNNRRKLQQNFDAPENMFYCADDNLSNYQKQQTFGADFKMLEVPEMRQPSFINLPKSYDLENRQKRFRRYPCPKPVRSSQNTDEITYYEQNYHPDFVFSSQQPKIPQRCPSENYFNRNNYCKMDDEALENSYYSEADLEMNQRPINTSFSKKLTKQRASRSQFLIPKKYDWHPYMRNRNDVTMMSDDQDAQIQYQMSRNYNNSRRALRSVSLPFSNYQSEITMPRPNSQNDLLFMGYVEPSNDHSCENSKSAYSQSIPRRSIVPNHYAPELDDFESYEK